MPIASVDDLIHALRQHPLLEPGQREELTTQIGPVFSDPRLLSKELLMRGWLTPFQVNHLLQGHGKELVLGPYILLERITEGPMGDVYKARHQHMKRIVALQVIRPELLQNAEAVERFYEEVQAASRVSHPHLVASYDAGPVGATHFFAMEYVEGIDLDRLVQQSGPLPPERTCDFLRQAALGLQHAFERGLRHHDLKPSNLLVTGHTGAHSSLTPVGNQIKVRNLGLTVIRQPTRHTKLDAAKTKEATAFTSPDYIAPERAATGQLGDVRAEVYSLGCTFYFLLTGQVPFPGGTVAEKHHRHQQEEPAPLSDFRRDVPPPVEAALRRMMAKYPEERYQTPGEAALALALLAPPEDNIAAVDTAVDEQPPDQTAPSQTAPLPIWERRRAAERQRWQRWVKIGGVALLVGVVLFLFLLLRPGSGTPATQARAKPPTEAEAPPVLAARPALVIHCGRGGGGGQEIEVTSPGYECRLLNGRHHDGWGGWTAKSHAWLDAREVRFQLKLPPAVEGRLRMHFVSDNGDRKERVVVQGKPVGDVDRFQDAGKWLDVPVTAAMLKNNRLDVAVQNLLEHIDAVISTVEFTPLVPQGSEPPLPPPALVVQCGRDGNKRETEVVMPGYHCELHEGAGHDGWQPPAPRSHLWAGDKIRFYIFVPLGTPGTLRLFCVDGDNLNRQQVILVQGRLVRQVDQFAGAGKWVEVPITGVEAREGRIEVILEKRGGPNAVISTVEFVPRHASAAEPPGTPALVIMCGRGGGAAWPQEERITRGYGYRLLEGQCHDGWGPPAARSYCWHGGAVRFEVLVPSRTPGTLRLFFVDDGTGRAFKVTVGRKPAEEVRNQGPTGKWLSFSLAEADTADGKVEVTLQNLANSVGVAISTIEFIPTKK